MGHLCRYNLVIIRQVFLQIVQYVLISDQIEQRCRQTLLSSTARPTDPMDVLSDVGWGVVVDHVGNILYVDTSCNDICTD